MRAMRRAAPNAYRLTIGHQYLRSPMSVSVSPRLDCVIIFPKIRFPARVGRHFPFFALCQSILMDIGRLHDRIVSFQQR